jgi:hypothetical protein
MASNTHAAALSALDEGQTCNLFTASSFYKFLVLQIPVARGRPSGHDFVRAGSWCDASGFMAILQQESRLTAQTPLPHERRKADMERFSI